MVQALERFRQQINKRFLRKGSLLLATFFLPPLIQVTSLQGDYQALAYLGLLNTPQLVQEDNQLAFENVLCSCVRIQVDGHYGSGSIFRMTEDEIIIATNRHVLQYWNQDSYITFFDGAVASGELIGVADEADVGFVRVPITSFTYDKLLTYRNVRLVPLEGDEDSEQEENVTSIANDSKTNVTSIANDSKTNVTWLSIDLATDIWKPQLYQGVIIDALVKLEDFEVEMLYGRGAAQAGMSGGGVFDGYGNYIGMMTGGTLQDEIAAVPAETVWQEYRELV